MPLFPAAVAYQYFWSVYGIALSFVCDFYEWNGHGGTIAASLWYGIGIDYDYPVRESAGQCIEKVFWEKSKNKLD